MMAEDRRTRTNSAWYQMPAAEVMASLGVDRSGLTSGEAKARLSRYGHNELSFRKRSALTRFLLQFNSPLVYVLLAAAAVTAFLGMWVDAGVILVVVLANTVIGSFRRAEPRLPWKS